VAWLNDPDMNIAVHMTMGAFSDGTVFNKGKSRYNELNIKVTTIDIAHLLRDAHLVGYKEGWQDAGGRGFVTRASLTGSLCTRLNYSSLERCQSLSVTLIWLLMVCL
jgi:hypothetical protein